MTGREARRDYEIVIVSYLSRVLVEQLLDSLPVTLPVVVVDNARNRDSLRQALAPRTNARYVDSGGGKGFAKAANIGARSSSCKYLIFVNPDSRPTPAVFEALLEDLDRDPMLASVAATTVGADGRAEVGAGGWEPTVRRAFVHAVGLHKVLPRAGLWARPRLGQPIELDWTTGACLAVRRETFLRLGGFDERYYVYNEDVAYGRQARAAGLRQRLRTDLRVAHRAGSSGGGSAYMLQLRGASLMEYLRDHGTARQRHLIRCFLTAGSAARAAALLAKRRRHQAEGHAAYVRGLWRGRPADPVTFDSDNIHAGQDTPSAVHVRGHNE